jgi:hypothetical protein
MIALKTLLMAHGNVENLPIHIKALLEQTYYRLKNFLGCKYANLGAECDRLFY